MKTVIGALLVLYGLTACGGGQGRSEVLRPPQLTDYFQSEAVPAVPSAYLCAVRLENSFPEWFMFDRNDIVKVDIDGTEYTLGSFSVSPDGRFVSIESIGEGHPILQVYAISGFMRNGSVKYLQGWDPYPGWINEVGWQGDTLVLESNVPLHTDYDRTAYYDDDTVYRFMWSLDGAELELID